MDGKKLAAIFGAALTAVTGVGASVYHGLTHPAPPTAEQQVQEMFRFQDKYQPTLAAAVREHKTEVTLGRTTYRLQAERNTKECFSYFPSQLEQPYFLKETFCGKSAQEVQSLIKDPYMRSLRVDLQRDAAWEGQQYSWNQPQKPVLSADAKPLEDTPYKSLYREPSRGARAAAASAAAFH